VSDVIVAGAHIADEVTERYWSMMMMMMMMVMQ
jgi:hypothetical protein